MNFSGQSDLATTAMMQPADNGNGNSNRRGRSTAIQNRVATAAAAVTAVTAATEAAPAAATASAIQVSVMVQQP